MALNGILKTPGRKQILGTKLKDPVEVFCRVRPLHETSVECCVEIVDSRTLQLNAPKVVKSLSNQIEQVKCTFTKVFADDVGQSEVFNNIGLPLMEDLLGGRNGLCFMYGITGSGKTHTMNGTPTNGGVLPRCLDALFNSIETLQTNRCVFKPDGYNGFEILSEEDAKIENDRKLKELDAISRIRKNNMDMNDVMRIPDGTLLGVDEDCRYAVFISYVEIYNNSVFDLLDETTLDPIKQTKPSSKILREDPRRNMFVYDVTELEVKSADEAYNVFWKGQNKRKTAHTLLNTESSRSHSVFTIRLVQAPLGPNGDQIMKDKEFVGISQLSLCDLAGSERLSRTKADGDRVREAGNINNSLMTLRSCIECLRENQKNQENGNRLKIVPYRDSKLTHLFKNYFDGDGKVRMIVCLNPAAEDFDESLHVMRFAEMTQEVKVARSEGVKFDLGLTPGRGKASKAFKETFKDVEDGIISSDVGSEEDFVRTLQQFAPWPSLELTSCNDSITLPNLIQYLQNRMRLRKILVSDWKQKHAEMRNIIIQLEQDNVDLTKALEEQRSRLNEKEKENRTYEKRIRSVTEKNESLQRSFDMQKRQADVELDKLKDSLQKEKSERVRLKQTLKDLTSSERLRWEKECDKRVRATQLGMEEQILAKSEKLRQLRHVVQGLQLPEENQVKLNSIIGDEKPAASGTGTPCTPVTVTRTRTTTHTSSHSSQKSKRPPVHAKPQHRVKTTRTAMTPKLKVRSKSPPPSAPSAKSDVAPVRGRHRRSFSSDWWLEHKPSDTVPTDTVMQPTFKKKKTVDIPNVKDLKSTPNYILTHQEEDSSGEIETKLIKGEVLKTRGGGTSVQFTDIETLKKTLESKGGIKVNPKPPKQSGQKRKSDGDNQEVNSDDSWTSVETRCAIGIEGKAGSTPGIMHHAKKSKH